MDFRSNTQVEIVNATLDRLKEYSWQWFDTNTLRRKLGISYDEATAYRMLLKRMERAGLVRRRGVKSFEWQIAVETWDRSNPWKGIKKVVYSDGHTHGDKAPMSTNFVSSDVDMDPPPTPKERHAACATEAALMAVADTVGVLRQQQEDWTARLQAELDQTKEKLEEVRKQASSHVKVLTVNHYDGKVVKLKNKVLPTVFQDVLDLASCRQNVLLVGPAGCGKSYLAKLVAEALDLPFYKVGGSGGLQEHHLLGASRPNLTGGKDRFKTTEFLKAFEEGGLCLIDELDGADSNVMLALNAALDDSGVLPVPNRGDTAAKSEDFVAVGTANTIGRGATRMYAGRNQIDEATLDRFRLGFVEMDYDLSVEAAVCPDDGLRETLQKVRKKIEQTGLRRIVSTRFMKNAHLMKVNRNWSVEKIVERFVAGWTPEEKAKVLPL